MQRGLVVLAGQPLAAVVEARAVNVSVSLGCERSANILPPRAQSTCLVLGAGRTGGVEQL